MKGRCILLLAVLFILGSQSAWAATIVNDVSVGNTPAAVVVNELTNKIYVANSGSNTVTVIDGEDNTKTTVMVEEAPIAIAVNSVTNKIYVANSGNASVTVIDGEDNTKTKVTVGSIPNAIAVNSVTNKIYVANSGSSNMTVIDGANNNTTTVTVGDGPNAIAVNSVTNKIYVANSDSDSVTVINGANNTTSTVTVGVSPMAVAVNELTNKIYVANYSGTVTVIDGVSNGTISVVSITSPTAVAVNKLTNKIYVINRSSNNMTVIDGTNNETILIIMGSSPNSIAVNSVTNKIYVANSASDNVTVIDGANNNTTTTVTAGDDPNAVVVNSITNRIYVTNSASDNVTVIYETPQNSSIRPTSASFDKKLSAQADVATTMTLNGNTLTSITNGLDTLTPVIDYTVSGSTVTILKAYLTDQPVGTTSLTFMFSVGVNRTLAITVSDTTPQNSMISPTSASFDKKVSAQADVVTTVTLNGNTLTSIANGVAPLTPVTDYTVSGSTVTILKAYLAGQPVGTTNLTFTFSGGANQTLAIAVSDTTPQNSTISPTSASFDKKLSVQADVTTTVTLNGNTLTSITNGLDTLTPVIDYTVSGSMVTILKAYLASQPVGTTNLTFTFSGGANQTLTIAVSDTNTAPTTTAGIIGTAQVGGQLTGTHTFSDADVGDSEGASTYRWLSSVDGVTYTAITGATSTTYTPVARDQGKTMKFEVTPVDNHGLAGTPVSSTATAAVASTPSGGGGGGSTPPDNGKVISKNGQLSLLTGKPGKVSLGEEIEIDIPANATDKELKLTIEKLLDTQDLLTEKDVLLSSVYEILKNFPENFKKPVTLTFIYDLNSLKGNQKPVIFYYDEVNKVWVEVGGTVNGNRISVEVDHFTKYAVFAITKEDVPPVESLVADVDFSDISGHWAEADIKQAVSIKLVNGYADGTFKPVKSVTREEFVVLLMNALKLQGEGAALTFTDKEKIGAWAQTAVAQAAQERLIAGYMDGSFRPDSEITRAEMAVMIGRALRLTVEPGAASGFTDDNSIPSWAKGIVAELKRLGIMEGTGAHKFDSDAKATRAEAVRVLLRMLAQ